VDLKIVLKEVLAAHRKWLESAGQNGSKAELRKAMLQEADLHGANLQEADLEGAHLSVADLMRTNLKGANLRNADFWMADMKDTLLNGANLEGANLAEVTNLTQQQLDSAITDERTVLPAGLHRR
jgi:uncharacterized protein YjbI with pentapeptide repeats